MVEPASTPADGNLKVVWVPVIADAEAPTLAELNAGTAVDLTEYLTADGYAPGTDEALIGDDRLSTRDSFSRPGRVTNSLEITYVFRGQDPAPTNKAYFTLRHLTTGFIVERWGAAYEDAWAAGDVVDVRPAQCGKQRKQPPEANSVHKVTQTIHHIGTKIDDAVVAA